MEGDKPASIPRGAVLAMLVVAYAFNYLDRQILAILAIPIKGELGLTDQQLALLMGLAFAVFYTGLGVPVAALAERTGRARVLTRALALWSAFTALCGTVTGFWPLFLCRMGVGIGEAGGVAPAHSLIADLFPQEQRGRALALYSFGIPIGSALGFLFGGLIARQVSWRWAFVVVGVLGLLLAPVFHRVVREPERSSRPGGSGLAETVGLLRRKRSFWLLALGAASASICGYGVASWLPTFLVRSMKFDLGEVSVFLAAVHLVGGLAGVWAGGALGDRLARGDRSKYPLIPAVAFLLALPVFLAGMNSTWVPHTFVLLLIPQALNMAWLGPVLAAVQALVPASMRATASAAFLFINNLVGLGFGTFFFGFMSDQLRPTYGDESMRYAIYSGLGFYVLAAVLLVMASRTLARDGVD